MDEKKMKHLKNTGMYRQIRDRDASYGSKIRIGNREFINFASNDYLGFCSDGTTDNNIKEIIKEYGFGAGASRLLSGGTSLHGELERLIAQFKGVERVLLMNSGYSANTGVIPSLANEASVIFSDELNHASIIDGCRLSKTKKVIYRHGDISHLRKLVKENEGCRGMIVTDSIFSMDGDIAPLRELYDICNEEGFLLYLDDAHGTGVLGNGRGALSHFNLSPTDSVIQMGTLSKAIGSFGAFVCAHDPIIDYLTNTSRTLIYSTALPPVCVAAAFKVIESLLTDQARIETLWSNVEKVHSELTSIGVNKGKSTTQIIPLIFSTIEEANSMAHFFERNGIYAPVIRPPTVKEPRIRVSITAIHTEKDINTFIDLVRGYFAEKK